MRQPEPKIVEPGFALVLRGQTYALSATDLRIMVRALRAVPAATLEGLPSGAPVTAQLLADLIDGEGLRHE